MKKQTRIILTVSAISIILMTLIVLLVLKFTQGTAIDLNVESCFEHGNATCYINQTTLSTLQDTVYSIENGKYEVQIKQPPKWAGCAGCSSCSSCSCGSGVKEYDAYGCPKYYCYAKIDRKCTSTWNGSKGGGSISGYGKSCNYNVVIFSNGTQIYQTSTTFINTPITYMFGDISEGKTYSLSFGKSTAVGDACQYIEGSITTSKPIIPCGNGKIDSFEVCDANSIPCNSSNYKGIQTCNAQCAGFDTCIANESYGDGIINGDETCDTNNFGSATCQDFGFKAGKLTCRDNGATIDKSLCTNNICGNNILEIGEICDNDTISCQYPLKGEMTCKSDCSDYDNSTCISQTGEPISIEEKSNLPIIIGGSIAVVLLIIGISLFIMKRK